MVFMAQVNWIVGTSQTSRGNAVVLNMQQKKQKTEAKPSKIWIITIISTSVAGTTYDTCVQMGTHNILE